MAKPTASHSTRTPDALEEARRWAESLDESVSRLQDIQLACGGLKNLLGSVQRLESQDLLADRDELWALTHLIHQALSTAVQASHESLQGLHQALAPPPPQATNAAG
ncbi:MAG: hypothetical protein EKK45_01450 [Curvibacter sp.]|nr:MAG: hypothetical protein EKK45_01450 [Curvibacter sp.]